MTTPDASLGHEEEIAQESEHPDYIIESEPSVQTQAGVFEGLRSWGRGAFGKVMLAAALVGGGVSPVAEGASRDEYRQQLRQILNQARPAKEVNKFGFTPLIVIDGVKRSVTVTSKMPAGRPEEDVGTVLFHPRTKKYYIVYKNSAGFPSYQSFALTNTDVLESPAHEDQPQQPILNASATSPEPTSSAPAASPEVKRPEGYVPPSKEVLDAEREVLAMKIPGATVFTLDQGEYTNNPNEAALHGPSIIEPTGYTVTPISINASVKMRGRAFKTKALLPCPRKFIDQGHAGGLVVVRDEDNNIVESTVRVVYSQPNNEGVGYINPYLLVEINDSRARGWLNIFARHCVIVPQYPSITEDELLTKTHEYAPIIKRAMRVAAEQTWTPATDCGYKAELAMQVAPLIVDSAEGFSVRKPETDIKFNFKHVINCVATPHGSFTFDGRSPSNCYMGPLDGFFPTAVGREYNIPDWKEEPIIWSNDGNYRNVSDFRGAHLSIPGLGVEGEYLSKVEIPPPIQKYAAVIWGERMQNVYRKNNIALNR